MRAHVIAVALALTAPACGQVYLHGTLPAQGGRALGCIEAAASLGHDPGQTRVAGTGTSASYVLVDISVGNACRDPVTLHFDAIAATLDDRSLRLSRSRIADVTLDADASASEVLAFVDDSPSRGGNASVCLARRIRARRGTGCAYVLRP